MENKIPPGLEAFSFTQNILKKYSFTVTITLFGSILLNLLLLIALNVNMSRKQIIVGIDEQGMPYAMQQKNENLRNLTNRKRFVDYFVQKLYHWDSENYIENIKTLLPLMAKDIQNIYIGLIQENSYASTVEKERITSVIDVKPIEGDFEPYKEGFRIKVQAIKVRIVDFIKRETAVEFSIAIRPCGMTNDNIWGLEVFEFTEQQFKDIVADQ